MSTMIQIRNVPDELHRTLRVRAAQAGMSLSEYLLREIVVHAAQPPLEEVLAGIKADGAVAVTESAADAVRAERDSR